jgi:glutamine cyclotransferase
MKSKSLVGVAVIFFLLVAVSGFADRYDEASRKKSYDQVTRDYVLEQKAVPVFTFQVVKKIPHDTESYTEGLILTGGFLYEGTGLYGRSHIQKIDPKNGAVVKKMETSALHFGEGLTVFGNDIIQLTYKSNTGFIYDKGTFEQKGTFHYPFQGWGLTQDGQRLIMSNGSAALLFLDPRDKKQTGYVIVHDDRGPIGWLNELEYVDGQVYANIWQSDLIVRIDPESGKVTAWIDLTGLNPEPDKLKYPYVLNGITSDKEGRLIVTGKCWPYLYTIELVPVKKPDH